MDLHSLRTDADRSGWIVAVVVRLLAHLEKALGVWIYRVNVRLLGESPAKPHRVPEGITIRALTEADLLEASTDRELYLDPDFIRGAMARGDLCCGAYLGEALVAYTWRAPATAPFRDDLWVRVKDPLHYVYKSFTRPEHRGKGLHIALTRDADSYMLKAGRPAEVGFIDISNVQSLGAARSLGRRKIGWAGYTRVFGRCYMFRSGGVKDAGAEFFVPESRQADVSAPATASVSPAAAVAQAAAEAISPPVQTGV